MKYKVSTIFIRCIAVFLVLYIQGRYTDVRWVGRDVLIDILTHQGQTYHPETLITRKKRTIMLGTKWCGHGDKAKSEHDLGRYKHVDRCCMRHDKCPLKIYKNEEKWGLKNTRKYPITDCRCDDDFYDCLKKTSRKNVGWFEHFVGKFVGKLYFNILRSPCVVIPDEHRQQKTDLIVDNLKSNKSDSHHPPFLPASLPKARFRKAKPY